MLGMRETALRWCLSGTDLPSVAQRHHVVDIDVARRAPGRAVIRAEPAPGGRGTCGIGHDAGAVSLQNGLASIARSGLGDPVREQIAGVAILGPLRSDTETRQLALSCGSAGNVGRGAGDQR